MTRQCCVKLFKDPLCLFEPFFIAHSLETRHQVILLFRLMRPGLTKRAIEDCIASHCGDTLVLALYQFSEALGWHEERNSAQARRPHHIRQCALTDCRSGLSSSGAQGRRAIAPFRPVRPTVIPGFSCVQVYTRSRGLRR